LPPSVVHYKSVPSDRKQHGTVAVVFEATVGINIAKQLIVEVSLRGDQGFATGGVLFE
jgi:hypothetical protein